MPDFQKNLNRPASEKMLVALRRFLELACRLTVKVLRFNPAERLHEAQLIF